MADSRSAEGRHLNNTKCGEIAQCLSHRALADSEPPCNSRLDYSGAWAVLAGKDRFQQVILHSIAEDWAHLRDLGVAGGHVVFLKEATTAQHLSAEGQGETATTLSLAADAELVTPSLWLGAPIQAILSSIIEYGYGM